MKLSSYIEIPCLRGIQGANAQYLTNLTAATLIRLVGIEVKNIADNPETSLDQGFIRERCNELKQPDSNISLSPIVIAVLGEVYFSNMSEYSEFGIMRISASTDLSILDGLHRIAALVAANLSHSRLSKETVPVIFIPVADSTRLDSLRGNLSKKFSKTGGSISRNRLRKNTLLEMTKDVVTTSHFLSQAVAIGKSSLAPRAQQLLTHTGFSRACAPIFKALDQSAGSEAACRIAEFWDGLCQTLQPWQDYLNSKVNASEVRSETILSSTTVLVALGRLGAELLALPLNIWKEKLSHLSELNWRRGQDASFEGSAILNGVLLKGDRAEELTLNLLKLTCGL